MAQQFARALALATLFTIATTLAIGPRPVGQPSWDPKNAMGDFPEARPGNNPSTFATMVSSVPSGPNAAVPSHAFDQGTPPDRTPPFQAQSNPIGTPPPGAFTPPSATATGFPTSSPAVYPSSVPYFAVPVNDTDVGGFPHPRPSMRPDSIPPFAHPENATGTGWFLPSRPENGTGVGRFPPPRPTNGSSVGWFPPSRPVNDTGSWFPPSRPNGTDGGWFPPSRPVNGSGGDWFPPSRPANATGWFHGSRPADATGHPTSYPSLYQRSIPPFPMPNATATAPFNSTMSGLPLCSGPPATYTVAHMDRVDKIAARFNVSVEALESANSGKVLYWDLLPSGMQLEIPQAACSRYRPTGTGASLPTPTMNSMVVPTPSTPAFGPQSPPGGPLLVTGGLAVTAFDRGAGKTTPEVSYTTFKGDGSPTDGWPAMADWLSWDSAWDNVKNYIGKRCSPDITPNSDDDTQQLATFVLSTSADAQIDPRFYLALVMQASNGCVKGPQIDNAQLVTSLNEAGAASHADPAQAYYHAARMYESGADGMSSPAASCYASDIANRLNGWSNGSTGRSPCTSE
ncbi:hypothetical protein H2200_001035 [Cladophialophora chaetospira]|uniref:LysM domain-containing protein n=1 Tax=Cladophialophora chaetospira TaxID=386627 RepID=A0AA38XPP2_9EURO|nr:hypothetical protein H2200_001035 [Cladophialophora chaetospira]